MLKNRIQIFMVFAVLALVGFGYTNCSPVHENAGSSSLSSLGECEDLYLDTFSKTFLAHSPESTASCTTCHSGNYMVFGDPASSWGSLTQRLGSKINVIDRLVANANGDNPAHDATFGLVSDADKATVTNFKSQWDLADSNCGE